MAKEKINTLDFFKIKNFCVKDIQQREKTTYKMGEKIYKSYTW